MTVRELRKILFCVENQDLTIKDFRALLFDIEEQDEEIKESDVARLTKN